MKKLLFLIFSLILNMHLTAYSMDEKTIILKLVEDDLYVEEIDRGNRMPTISQTCMIDFANLSIVTERMPMVISYELWNETGDAVVASYSTDCELVSFMSSQTGCFQLRLVTADATYIGYIEL